MSAPPPQPPTFYPPTYASSSAIGAPSWGAQDSNSSAAAGESGAAAAGGRNRSGSIYVDSAGGQDYDADNFSDSPAYEDSSMPPEQGSSRGGGGYADDGSEGGPGDKKKATRGARACLFCRKQKMKCVGGEDGPPCTRCKKGGKEVSRRSPRFAFLKDLSRISAL